jgi:hypothetical protein
MFITFTFYNQKKKYFLYSNFLALIQSAAAVDVGSSHVAESTPQHPSNTSQHITARLFSTPPAIDPIHT